MIPALVYIVTIALTCLVICTADRPRQREDPHADDVDAAIRRHPSNWSKATEDAIEQAVAIVDDGRALVRETEDWLRRQAQR